MFDLSRGFRISSSNGLLIWLPICLLLTATPAHAHPAHETNAEMVWNANSQSLEVALQLRGVDLEAALTQKASKRVNLDAVADLDGRIEAYIAKSFTVHSKAGRPVKAKYAGKSIESQRVWLYFEFPLDTDDPTGITVANRFLFGILENQKNKLALQVGDQRKSYVFDKRQATHELDVRLKPDATTWTPPSDLAELPSIQDLPNLFQMSDGTRVTTFEHWRKRREEIQQILQHFAYGHLPPRPDTITVDVKSSEILQQQFGASRQSIRLSIGSTSKLPLDISIHRPNSERPCPVIVIPVHRISEVPCLPQVLARGYALLQYERDDLDPDKPGVVGPAQAAYPNSDWATLGVWAWGAMRVVDYLETRTDFDLERIVLTGHSRDGKAALLAGALDERFAMVAPNGSGCGGGGCFRNTDSSSESLEQITDPQRFAYWFHPRLRWFAGREERLPFDQHFLKALVAPRPLLCTEARGDRWANPLGTRRTSLAARDLYAFLDAERKIGLTYRSGQHDQTLEDWSYLLEFADWHLFGKTPANKTRFWQSP